MPTPLMPDGRDIAEAAMQSNVQMVKRRFVIQVSCYEKVSHVDTTAFSFRLPIWGGKVTLFLVIEALAAFMTE